MACNYTYHIQRSNCAIYLEKLGKYVQVSLTGVTGARASVQSRVQGLLKEMKEVTLFSIPF